MGNQLEKDYTIGEKPFATGGPFCLWRIHNGTHRQTREEVSVFCCAFKDIEAVYGRNNLQTVINYFKNESLMLQKLRHPLILSPQQQFFETKTMLAMITEPILGSLNNLVFRNHQNIPDVSPMMKNYRLTKLELKYGMCQVMEALTFCHQNAKLTHAGLHPNNIYITTDGHWKISGFHFSFTALGSTETNSAPTLFKRNFQKRDFLPSLDYTAPEYVLEQNPCNSSDIFSFTLIYLQILLEKSHSILESDQDINAYTNNVSRLHEVVKNINKLPQEIRESLLSSCSLKHQERPTSHFLLSNCELLFGNEVRALRYLASMELREPVKKAQFLSTLAPMLKAPKPQQLINGVEDIPDEGFSNSIVFSKILPPLLNECKDLKMLLHALPNVLVLSERMTVKEFSKQVLPTLSKFALMQSTPAKIPLKILESFNLMWNKTTDEDHRLCLIPFLIRCLDSKFPEIQNEAMKRCEECLNEERMTYDDFKSTLLPPIELICHNTNNQSVRINGIVCLGKILPHFETSVISATIIPILESSLAPLYGAERSGAQLSAPLLITCVGVYLKISKLLQKRNDPGLTKIIACRIMPSISPIAVQTSLNVDQFTKYLKAMKTMIEMMEMIRYDEYRKAGSTVPDMPQLIPQDSPTSAITSPPFNPPQTFNPPTPQFNQPTPTFNQPTPVTTVKKPQTQDPKKPNVIQNILNEVPANVVDQNNLFMDEQEKENLLRIQEEEEELRREEERLRKEEEERQRIQRENAKLFDSLMDKHWGGDDEESPKEKKMSSSVFSSQPAATKPVTSAVNSGEIHLDQMAARMKFADSDSEDDEPPKPVVTNNDRRRSSETKISPRKSPISQPVVELAPSKPEPGSLDSILNKFADDSDDEDTPQPTTTYQPAISKPLSPTSFLHHDSENDDDASPVIPQRSTYNFPSRKSNVVEDDFDALLSRHAADSDDEY
ncbi:predicted protein [Naegleria gruberi]|uniref:Predicted protein n=1 Tax=Naegleria gruberi TaxID=5762 RepID=D2VQ78_NAEGR|nr:uncharacterized protein NAEGRDRAFT_58891 [Naegleria gruberi]EFC41060.1 predicted protein [Naegleria gruberi]|eukprot:XP_002673804.1 predicted protein [Naegleria gruberi strain NEG-M]